MTQQLNPPIPVSITSPALPPGVQATSRRGWCYAWKDTGIDGHRLWVVVLDETGEVVDTPQPEVRVDPNWSHGRRPRKDVRDMFLDVTHKECSHCKLLVEKDLIACPMTFSTCPSVKK